MYYSNLVIDEIKESFLIGDIRFPICDDDNKSIEGKSIFIKLRQAYPHAVTKPLWLNKRAIYSSTFNELYNPQVYIFLFNN